MQKQKYIGGVDFEELRAQRIQVYNIIELDLGTARSDEKMIYTGTYLYVLDATDIDTKIQVKLNEQYRGLIPLMKGRGVRAPFYRLYITNAAQSGKTITLAIGVESETFEVFDVGKALEISGDIAISGAGGAGDFGIVTVNLATLLLAANTNRRCAHFINIGVAGRIVYLGFDNTVTNADGFPLYPYVDNPLLSRITLVSQGDIWGWREDTLPADVNYLEENNL